MIARLSITLVTAIILFIGCSRKNLIQVPVSDQPGKQDEIESSKTPPRKTEGKPSRDPIPNSIATSLNNFETKENCKGPDLTGNPLVLMSGGNTSVDNFSWNLAAQDPVNDPVEVYTGPAYRTSPGAAQQVNPDCGGLVTYNTTLVAKYHDWQGEFINGISLQNASFTLKELESLEIAMRLPSGNSKILSGTEIEMRYGEFVKGLGNAELRGNEIDHGGPAFMFVLEQPGVDFPNGILKASYTLKIDINQLDQWLSGTLPTEAFTYFFEDAEFKRTIITFQEALELTPSFSKLNIMAATSGNNIRQYLVKKYPTNNYHEDASYGQILAPMAFKEQPLELVYLLFNRNQK